MYTHCSYYRKQQIFHSQEKGLRAAILLTILNNYYIWIVFEKKNFFKYHILINKRKKKKKRFLISGSRLKSPRVGKENEKKKNNK